MLNKLITIKNTVPANLMKYYITQSSELKTKFRIKHGMDFVK